MRREVSSETRRSRPPRSAMCLLRSRQQLQSGLFFFAINPGKGISVGDGSDRAERSANDADQSKINDSRGCAGWLVEDAEASEADYLRG